MPKASNRPIAEVKGHLGSREKNYYWIGIGNEKREIVVWGGGVRTSYDIPAP